MDLFAHGRQAQIERESPLANRMRPRTLDEYVGQSHIMGPGRLLRRAIQADQLASLIFYGPPGTGKTTLAMVIANTTESHFITINAVLAGVKQIREAIETAKERRDLYGQRTTLFVDEVHRWNKAQQDALLPHVENGTLILIGATTENPYFEVNKALVSRSRIFQLKPLTQEDLRQIAYQTMADQERGYGRSQINLHPDALDHLVDIANGDARGVLNALELAVETTLPNQAGIIEINLSVAEESIQRKAVLYDKEGDVHYDTISAFIKSLRGSDPDAALYWMAKMVYAGEDPRFIFRRMTILAGEDVGMADPNAMGVVTSCWQAFERIGMPEGRFPLAQAAIYLATAPKSNSTMAFFDALAAVEKERDSEVPNPLKDGNRDKEGFGHGKGYLYPHAYQDHWVVQQYLPDSLQGKLFYEPSDQGYEAGIQREVARRREAQLAAMLESAEWGMGNEEWGFVNLRLETGEILTTSPVDRGRDAWLQRTISQSGQNLALQREKLFELAQIQRHHLVLDLNAGSGLLTWEAVRHAPEGGVWALSSDAKAGEALRQQAKRFAEVERPSILIGTPNELNSLPSLRNEEEIRFDRIIARNLFTHYALRTTRAELIALLVEMLAGNGLSPQRRGSRICLIQTIPHHTQRLYKLVKWGDNIDLHGKVAAAEESIYNDSSNPLVNWDEADLEAVFQSAGLDVQIQLEKQVEQRRITKSQLAGWFSDGEANGGRLTYQQHLQANNLTPDECERVALLYRRGLQDRMVGWETAVATMIAFHK